MKICIHFLLFDENLTKKKVAKMELTEKKI